MEAKTGRGENGGIFQACTMAAFVVLQPGWKLGGVSARAWLVWLAVILAGLFFLRRGRFPAGRGRQTFLDVLVGVFLLWNLFLTVRGAVAMEGGEGRLLAAALALLFLLAPGTGGGWRVYVDVLLVCAVPVYLGLLWHFLLDSDYTYNLRPLLEGEQALASFLLLVVTLAAEGYCGRGGRARHGFCLGLAVAGYFLLFADGDTAGVLLGGLTFHLSLLLHRPGRERVKRTMRLAFAYFFLLSNMPLLTEVIPLLKTGAMYSLEDGMYLELAAAVAGLAFLSWWDRLPEDDVVGLYRFREAVGRLLAAAGVVFFLLLAMGSRLEGMEGLGVPLLGRISEGLRAYCGGHNGTFMDVLEGYGVFGCVWLLCLAFAAVSRMRDLLERGKAGPCQMMVFILYAAQSVFFSQQSATAPIYVLLMAAALSGAPDRGLSGASGVLCRAVGLSGIVKRLKALMGRTEGNRVSRHFHDGGRRGDAGGRGLGDIRALWQLYKGRRGDGAVARDSENAPRHGHLCGEDGECRKDGMETRGEGVCVSGEK